ncbi:ABC transporter ATP-binding protein [Enterobacteriaceae bacterium YMB-R22]|jgi:ABC-2 type transport system ATP-binding protein|uniref:ABC transporter ATP-binding protein n=1 Tax=Tenebrionicola larvae TaxID=2815733 RepID=UPI0020124F80|nr:ABC transporter ATP-binding protein [Tenebrionicola larvae]MBV4414019.1 ABC transporter ATP-binding protein [Tenebrionicola larvae]
MEYSIALRGVSKFFGNRQVLKDISLDVSVGKITGFVGPDGSGKTTLMRVICGLERPDSGAGRCYSFDVFREAEQIRQISSDMSQNISLSDNLTVKENLLFLAKARNVPYAQRRIDCLTDTLDLTHLSDECVLHLTKALKLRVSLAASLLHSPAILMLDEPTAGIATGARREFWERLERLAAGKMTILVSTHYSDEAERCHHLVRMNNGRLLTSGSAQEVVHSLGLATFAIRGPDLLKLKYQFSDLLEVEQTVIFRHTLYVTGRCCDSLLSNIRMLPLRYKVEQVSSVLAASVTAGQMSS